MADITHINDRKKPTAREIDWKAVEQITQSLDFFEKHRRSGSTQDQVLANTLFFEEGSVLTLNVTVTDPSLAQAVLNAKDLIPGMEITLIRPGPMHKQLFVIRQLQWALKQLEEGYHLTDDASEE